MATSAKIESTSAVAPQDKPAEAPSAARGPSRAPAIVNMVVDVALVAVTLALALWVQSSVSPPPIRQRNVAVVPSAGAAGAGVTVLLGADNHLSMGNETLDEAAVVERLRAGGHPPATAALLVSADALYANVAAALGLFRRAGVGEVQVRLVP